MVNEIEKNINELSFIIGYIAGEEQATGEIDELSLYTLEKALNKTFEHNEHKNFILAEFDDIMNNVERTDGVNYEMGVNPLVDEFMPLCIEKLLTG